MPIDAGRLNRRIQMLRQVLAPDGHGAQVADWQEIGTVWAEAISQNGREAVISGTLTGVSAWRITVRFSAISSSLTARDQLKLDGRLLNIRSAEDPDGRREQLVIFADTASVQG